MTNFLAQDYNKMFNILERYLKNRVRDIDLDILEAVEQKKNSKILALKNIYEVLHMHSLVL